MRYRFHLQAAAVAIAVGLSGAAAAGEIQTCTRGDDVRTIEVLTPGVVGRACDLKVVRDNGSYVATPFHANNSAEFCAERARDIISGLTASGFQCAASPAPPEIRAQAPAPEPAAEPIAEAVNTPADAETAQGAAAEPLVAPTGPIADSTPVPGPTSDVSAPPPQAAAESPSDAAATPPDVSAEAASETAPPAAGAAAMQAPSPTPVAAAPAPVASLEQPAPAPLKAEEMQAPAGAPNGALANAGPVALAPTAVSAVQGVKSPRPAAGRLVGAAADARPVDRVAVGAPAASQTTESVTQQQTVVASVASDSTAKARPAEDIIKSVLAAQVAAWNDGDLDAFMGAYWKDPELRFLSGTSVSKGWRETYSRYRVRYGEGAAMGRLSFAGLDVDLVTDDVATVIGRFRLDRAAGSDAGMFTLVMKRFDGLWRIVHDHTVMDAPSKE